MNRSFLKIKKSWYVLKDCLIRKTLTVFAQVILLWSLEIFCFFLNLYTNFGRENIADIQKTLQCLLYNGHSLRILIHSNAFTTLEYVLKITRKWVQSANYNTINKNLALVESPDHYFMMVTILIFNGFGNLIHWLEQNCL